MKTPKTLELLPGESRVFAFDYGRQKEITEGLQTLLSAIITEDPANADLTISAPVVDGAKIKAMYTVAAGAAATTMQIFCDATTDASAVLGMVGNLAIIDPDSLEATP